jgi:hypothetical protein
MSEWPESDKRFWNTMVDSIHGFRDSVIQVTLDAVEDVTHTPLGEIDRRLIVEQVCRQLGELGRV